MAAWRADSRGDNKGRIGACGGGEAPLDIGRGSVVGLDGASTGAALKLLSRFILDSDVSSVWR